MVELVEWWLRLLVYFVYYYDTSRKVHDEYNMKLLPSPPFHLLLYYVVNLFCKFSNFAIRELFCYKFLLWAQFWCLFLAVRWSRTNFPTVLYTRYKNVFVSVFWKGNRPSMKIICEANVWKCVLPQFNEPLTIAFLYNYSIYMLSWEVVKENSSLA